MTRKRYIKLLMGEYCMPRNTARNCAKCVQIHGGTYLEDIKRCEAMVRQYSAEFGIPRRVLLTREKGADKAYRRYLKNLKRAVRVGGGGYE